MGTVASADATRSISQSTHCFLQSAANNNTYLSSYYYCIAIASTCCSWFSAGV